MLRPAQVTLLLLFLLLAARSGAAGNATVLFASDFSRGLTANWENMAFWGKKTGYTVVGTGTNAVLHAEAVNGCSALSAKLSITPSGRLKLHWRWHIDGIVTNGSERELPRFDHAARVFVAFDTFIGPPRTLNYVWANVEPIGILLDHPHSGRAKLFMVESGTARVGQWVEEDRDITDDWQRAFPGQHMSKLVGVGVMTDSDSLGGRVTGDYAGFRLTREPDTDPSRGK